MTALKLWSLGWAGVAAAMAALWAVQRRTGRADVVDLAWTMGTGGLSVFYAMTADGDPSRRALVAALSAAWSGRLGWHLAARIRRSPEDGRYARLRADRDGSVQGWLFGFFQAQAFLCAVFAVPALVAAGNPTSLGWIDALGCALWIGAVTGEGIADRQLDRFRRDPANRGAVCRCGLWRYSRHPNYFFEWIHWWSYVCMGWGAHFGWATLVGPVAMLLLIIKVTGIPPTEAQALSKRGQAYQQYQSEVSPFFPWFPKGGTR